MTRPFLLLAALASLTLIAFGHYKQPPTTSESTPEVAGELPTPTPEPVLNPPPGSLLFAAAANLDNLFVVNSDGSGLKRLTNSAERDEPGGFSPDGSLIAYASRERGDRKDGIYAVSTNGGDARLVAADPLWDWDPSWGSNGEILYEEGVEGYGTCWMVNPDGSGHVEISDKEACAGAEWSPDGQRIAIVKCGPWDRDVGTKCSLSILDDEGNLIRTVVQGTRIDSFDWSPDGNNLLFYSGAVPISISIIKADGTDLRTVEAPAGWRMWDPRWSPDGSQIVLSDFNQIGLISSRDGSNRTIAGRIMSWSPDGAQVAMKNDDGISAVSLRDGSTDTLVSGEYISAFSWSPDGKESAYISDDNHSLYVLRRDGSRTKVVTDPDLDGYTWSQDGRQILFA